MKVSDLKKRGLEVLQALSLEDQFVEVARDLEILLCHTLNWNRAELLTRSETKVSEVLAEEFLSLVARRARHEPIAYILGSKEFYGRDFIVNSSVLIPRPETELLVDQALNLVEVEIGKLSSLNLKIIDLCTGSGVIIISLLCELRRKLGEDIINRGEYFATDISSAALEVAVRNAHKHNLATTIKFSKQDLLKDSEFIDTHLKVKKESELLLILSNPPYVSDLEILQPEVLRFEPSQALFAGNDGLAVIRELLYSARDLNTFGAQILIEFGYAQRPAIEALLSHLGYQGFQFYRDLQGIDRVLHIA